jgi:CheY-like chemotaxis protein
MDVYLKEDCQGIKAAKWLNDACDIPVLFVTGHGDKSTLERIHALLPEAPLCAKPIDPDRLAQAIARATGWDMPVATTSS